MSRAQAIAGAERYFDEGRFLADPARRGTLRLPRGRALATESTGKYCFAVVTAPSDCIKRQEI